MAQESNESAPADHAGVVVRPPLLWLILFLVGYAIDRWVYPLPFLPANFPAVWLGVLVWLAGLVLVFVAVSQFRRAGTDVSTHTPTDAIVDHGLYAYSRNPIYVAGHIGMVGAAIAADSLWVAAMLLPFYLVIRYGVVAREEAYLERKFGQPYRDYQARVRRWF